MCILQSLLADLLCHLSRRTMSIATNPQRDKDPVGVHPGGFFVCWEGGRS